MDLSKANFFKKISIFHTLLDEIMVRLMKYPEALNPKKKKKRCLTVDRLLKNNKRKKKIIPQVDYTTEQKMKLKIKEKEERSRDEKEREEPLEIIRMGDFGKNFLSLISFFPNCPFP